MLIRHIGFCLVILSLVFGNVFGDAGRWRFAEIANPAAAGSGEPNLAGGSNHIYMSWLEPTAHGGHAFRFAKWDGKNWSPAATIIADVPFFVNWADFPSLLETKGGTLTAHWLQKSGGGVYAYDVMISTSKDNGKTWSTPEIPHKDGVKNEHGFVSLLDQGGGSFAAVWLDSRNIKSGDHGDSSGHGAMALMYSQFQNGKFNPEEMLDRRVCDCCQTAAAITTDGIFVAFRDRSESEVRDISYVRFSDGKWSQPKTLFADNWKISACPVNGPAVAASGSNLVVAWFTAAGGKEGKVQTIFSADDGKTFGKPVRVDQGNATGRVDVKWLPDGRAVVSWLENTGQGADIRIRTVRPNGTAGPYFTVAQSSSARASGFPRIIVFGKDLVIAWTQAGDPQQIRTGILSPQQ